MCRGSPTGSSMQGSGALAPPASGEAGGLRRRLSTADSISSEGSFVLPPNSSATSSKAKVDAAHAVDDSSWTELEHDLFDDSCGLYNPQHMARCRRVPQNVPGAQGTGSRLEVRGRVSIVTPTMSSRQRYHESLWACFEAQTYLDKELVVLETYETTPSPFLQRKAAEDKRLVLVSIKVEPDEDFSVGLKRNMTLHLASGEYIVNFDDDDLYAPCYVTTMVNEMKTKGLYAVTLSAWYNYYVTTGECTFSDPSSWDDWASSEAELDEILYGYGFSYCYRRHVALESPYPDAYFAEDAPFFLGLRDTYGKNKVSLLHDDKGICMHIMHRANSAEVLGTCEVEDEDLDELAISSLKPFELYRAAAEERKELGVIGRALGDFVHTLTSLVASGGY